MAKSFLEHLAKEADKSISRSVKNAEKRRKKALRDAEKRHKKALRDEEKRRISEAKKIQKEIERSENLKKKKEEKIRLSVQKAKDFQNTGDLKKAINMHYKTLSLDPYNKPTYDALINIYHNEHNYEKEEDIIVEALEYFPDNNDYKNKLIQVAKFLTE